MEDLRYPIGRFDPNGEADPARRPELIAQIARAPAALRAAIDGLREEQLDTPYREGGWTVRQVVHHVPDSHLQAYVRFKLALTEDAPRIKTYEEARWAELPDTPATPVGVSLALLDALHARWVALLERMSDRDFRRPLDHPEMGIVDLDVMLRLYAWHGRHHTAHVEGLRRRAGW